MRVAVLIPAYNSAHTLPAVVERIPDAFRDLMLVVDDGSQDATSHVALSLGAKVIRHDPNRGYGEAQKSLYRAALDMDVDATVIVHSDGGHWPEDIPAVLEPLERGLADVATGSRLLGVLAGAEPRLNLRTIVRGVRSPMPLYKVMGHVMLTNLQNACYGTDYSSFHDGMRACTTAALRRIRMNELNGWYRFDTEFIIAAHNAGLRIREIPIRSNYTDDAPSGLPSVRYGIEVVSSALRYRREVNGRLRRPLPSTTPAQSRADGS